MRLSHLSLRDFRSYAEVELPLAAGVTALVGPNGQGKTNLVEAVGYLATLSSHRVAQDAPLVRLGAERAVVRGQVVRSDRSLLVEVEITPGRANRARVNRGPVPRPRDVLGILRTVLFAPEDLALVKGDPGERRRFLDDLLVLRAPRFAAVRSDYDRVLRQRNALLKSAGGGRRQIDLGTLDVWDTHLSSAGAELVAGRLELVDALAPLVDKAYASVAATTPSEHAANGPAAISYRTSLAERPDEPMVTLVPDRQLLAAVLLERLSAGRRAELERGVSLVGPHRDDLVLTLGPMPARGMPAMASRGPSRWRCGWRRTTCCAGSPTTAASRCWSSTTSSPSSTCTAGTGWPVWSPVRNRCW